MLYLAICAPLFVFSCITFSQSLFTITHFSIDESLSYNSIECIYQDKQGYLWIRTSNSLSIFAPIAKIRQNYDEHNGLPLTKLNVDTYFGTKFEKLFFGTDDGIISFYPDSSISSIPPRTIITECYELGEIIEFIKPINKMEKIELKYAKNYFSFNFVRLYYKHMLEPHDNKWNCIAREHEISHVTNTPESCKFIVNNCLWDEAGKAVQITTAGTFWYTWWFITLVFSTIPFIYILVLNIRKSKSLSLEKAKTEERHKVRKKIASDIHDELGFRTTQISYLSEILQNELKSSNENSGKYLNKLKENATDLFNEMRELIWSLDPDKDSLYHLIEELKKFSDQLFVTKNIAFDVVGMTPKFEEIKLPVNWKQQIFRIFKEGLHNIYKHAKDCKQVQLQILLKDDNLEICLKDNGIGFLLDCTKQGNGLKNMEMRSNDIGGSLTMKSKIGIGTDIYFSINYPLG